MMDTKMNELANEVETIVKTNNRSIKNLVDQTIGDAMQVMLSCNVTSGCNVTSSQNN